jgi:hypothetical protein
VKVASPQLSIVIPTIRGWPDARVALDPLLPQAERIGAELIVIDGSKRRPPTDLPPFVRWARKPGWSVFQLRAWGYGEAKGEIVAVTEDHCVPAADWCERILAAFREHPDAQAIGGAVENGADKTMSDWAAFFLTQAPYMAPLEHGPARVIAAPVNVGYKQAVLDRLAAAEGEGVIDFMEMSDDNRALFVTDDRIRVKHDLSKSFWEGSLAQFDNGRSIAGYRRPNMTRMDYVRMATVPIMPIYRTFRTIRRVMAKDASRATLARSTPTIVWFQYCASVGELIGYLKGPGDSPTRLY